jgi:two-component system, OmpR family, copper resistance phosphate regulon response regulator CusR
MVFAAGDRHDNRAASGVIVVHILVVEDEQKVAEALRAGLEAQPYQVSVAHSGEEGLALLDANTFDIVVLDLMLPGRDGLDVLRTIRQRGLTVPVLVLTARDTVEDRVLGLDSGADDYLVKPFAFPELLARIRVLVRRGRADLQAKLTFAGLELDLLTRQATRNGAALALTSREFDLLAYLLRHQREVVSREMLAADVWQQPVRATPLDNVIDVQIARLRRKVDDPFATSLIHTVRGVGFTLREGSP